MHSTTCLPVDKYTSVKIPTWDNFAYWDVAKLLLYVNTLNYKYTKPSIIITSLVIGNDVFDFSDLSYNYWDMLHGISQTYIDFILRYHNI
jgi:hypothetical protein